MRFASYFDYEGQGSDPAAAPRGKTADYLVMDLLVGRHRGGCERLVIVG